MFPLKRGTARPELIVDPWAFRLRDPVSKTYVGRAANWGRQRVVYALPTDDGPRAVRRASVVVDPWGFRLVDPAGNLVGRNGVWINRILNARWTEDTRRL